MSWPKIVLIVWFAYTTLITIAVIGKPRKPITPGFAIYTVVIAAIVVTLVVLA